jgi:hypothetical protein
MDNDQVERVARTIYVASKTKHAHLWRRARAEGLPINSTWIDEAGAGESACLNDLWRRCIAEASSADVLIVYCEPGDVLKGAWVEVGAALASGVKVLAVGIEEFSIAKYTGIEHCANLDDAFVRAAIAAMSAPEATGKIDGLIARLNQTISDDGTKSLRRGAALALASLQSRLETAERENDALKQKLSGVEAENDGWQRLANAQEWNDLAGDAKTLRAWIDENGCTPAMMTSERNSLKAALAAALAENEGLKAVVKSSEAKFRWIMGANSDMRESSPPNEYVVARDGAVACVQALAK